MFTPHWDQSGPQLSSIFTSELNESRRTCSLLWLCPDLRNKSDREVSNTREDTQLVFELRTSGATGAAAVVVEEKTEKFLLVERIHCNH